MSLNSTTALYPQYKEDTKIVAQWLDATSKALGFISAGDSQRQAGVKRQYTICIADFGLMADFLSLKGHVSIPSYIWSSLSRAIRYRSTYGNYLQQQRKTTADSHKNHLFFIDVLRKVQTILKSISKPTTAVAPIAQPAASLVTRLAGSNVPQPATVEDEEDEEDEEDDEDDEDDESPPIPAESSPKPPGDDILFKPWEEDEEEALFQWRLFTVDIQRIRSQIRQLWELYRAGHLSLGSVATAHNMAIHMVRKLEQDINPVIKKCGGYVHMSLTHFLRRYVGTAADFEETKARLSRLQYVGGETDRIPTVMPTTSAIIDGFDIAEEEMVFSWQVLLSETWTWTQCGTFGSYNGKWGPFIPRDDRQSMTSLQKYNQDKAVACGIIHDVQILATYLNPHVGMRLDELSEAIGDLVPWNVEDLRKHHCKQFEACVDKATFRAVFATQLLLDSTHALGTHVDHPYRELLEKSSRIFKSAKSLREFYEGPGARALGRLAGPSCLEPVENAAKFWQGEDPVAQFRRKQSANSSEMPTKKVDAMLCYDAPLCGWWLQALQTISYSSSLLIANSLGLPVACARLYFAFVQEGLIPKGSWPDMEAFSVLHRDDFWVGGAAPKPGQYLQNMLLADGNSVVSLASDARVHPRSIRQDRIKLLTCGAKVSWRIADAFVDRRVQGLNEEDLERLMAGTKLRWYNGKAVKPCFHHGWDKAGNHKGDSNPASSKTNNPFLRLAQAIDAETLEQSFDYMTLNRVCWMVLRELLRKGRPILDAVTHPRSGKPTWKTTESSNICSIAGYIFCVLFLPDGTVLREEASAIADILLNLTKALGRVVHTSTGIDWAHALKCTCDDIPS